MKPGFGLFATLAPKKFFVFRSAAPCHEGDVVLPLRFLRRPIYFGLASAVEARNPIAGLATRLGQRGKDHRGLVVRTSRLAVEQMLISHCEQRRFTPGRGSFFFSGHQFLPPTLGASEVERLYPVISLRTFARLNRTWTSRHGAWNLLPLQRFHKDLRCQHPAFLG